MCLRLWTSVLLTAAAPAVSAQGASYYPLNEGDEWTYERTSTSRGTFAEFVGYRHVAARADTTIGGEPYRLLDVTFRDVAQTVDSTARCAARVDPASGAPVWVALSGTCEAYENGIPFGTAPVANSTFYVGETPYTGRQRVVTQSDVERGAASEGVGLLRAAGPGVAGEFPWLGLTIPRQTLLRARVSGVTYGEMPSPMAWREFAPLAVGDRHLYRSESRNGVTRYYLRAVVGTREVQGVAYAVVTTRSPGVPDVESYRRFRDDLGCVVLRQPDGSESCTQAGTTIHVRSKIRAGTVVIEGEPFPGRIISDYATAETSTQQITFVAGIGIVSETYSNTTPANYSRYNLVYASVGGVEVGTEPAWAQWPAVAAEESGPVPASLTLRAPVPNPTSAVALLRVESDAARLVRLVVADALGRVVERRDVLVLEGVSEISVDLRRQAAGVYRVRLSDDRGATSVVAVTRL